MFGRRSNDPSIPQQPSTPLQPGAPGPSEPQRAASAPARQSVAPQVPARVDAIEQARRHSEEYYDVKTSVFNALIDTIDLTQLAKLETAAARTCLSILSLYRRFTRHFQ
jgi:pilus assembly protein CpaF